MLFKGIGHFFLDLRIFIWDAWLTLLNVVLPRLPSRARGIDSEDGSLWPEYVPPKEGDSRCSCPALNALANHGILPHDGKNVKFTEITDKVHETFNFAVTFATYVSRNGADTLGKDYNKDTCNLSDLDKHNGIEHDASLLRQDAYFSKSQGQPHIPYIEELLALASSTDSNDKKVLTVADLSKFSSKRRADSRRENPQFQLDDTHKIFGSANSSTLLAIFGGKVDDLEIFLKEERIPERWESTARSRKGLTFIAFNPTTFKVEHGIDEKPYEKEEGKKGEKA
ncbi:hypothetical protein HMN09_00818200 [Mycena chlorophos]|uniref:Heme haloperoxidase family profile domain-containing protein n=1 Tax=Mycena chlorophos TaxID=658473 RepID=A0A8H6SUD1_MYCCL|nr:hypothetical protein HMN09_00818200 [Mycena chlorophos]